MKSAQYDNIQRVCTEVNIYWPNQYIQHDQIWTWKFISNWMETFSEKYSGVNKSLARKGMEQTNVSVRKMWISSGTLPRRKNW